MFISERFLHIILNDDIMVCCNKPQKDFTEEFQDSQLNATFWLTLLHIVKL